MAVISHCGVDYTAPTVEVQSDASATSLEATKVPTGQTITSYLNSKLDWKLLYGSSIAPSTTSTAYTPIVPVSSIHEIMVGLIYRSAGQYRQTLIFTKDMLTTSVVFPDFYWAGSRLYFSLAVDSNGNLSVSQAGASGSINWSSCAVCLFYR